MMDSLRRLLPRLLGKGSPAVFEPSRSLLSDLPMDPADAPESLSQAMPRLREFAEYCTTHGLTFVGMVCETDAVARSVAFGGRAVHMPVLAGFAPIMPTMLDRLRPIVDGAAKETMQDMKGDSR